VYSVLCCVPHCWVLFLGVICCSKGGGSQVVEPGLSPSFAKDTLGLYISITCGKISGPDRMSRKAPGKCILVDGQWYSPLEVESLGGKKAKRWRHSLHHLGKPLADYDLSCFGQHLWWEFHCLQRRL
jgi:hypothetical protein